MAETNKRPLFVIDTEPHSAESESNSKKLKYADGPKTKEQEDLEDFMFGDDSISFATTNEVPLGFMSDDSESSDSDSDSQQSSSRKKVYQPAWEDSDDEQVMMDISKTNRLRKLRKSEAESVISGAEYCRRLRGQFEKMSSGVEWAEIPDDDQDDIDFLQESGSLLSSSVGALPSTSIDISRMKDVNCLDYCKSVASSVQFHPNGRLVLVAGMDCTLRIFEADGLENVKVQGVNFDGFPIHTARFTPDGSQVVVSGRRKFFFVYDVESGAVTRIPGIEGRDDKSLERFEMDPSGRFIAFLCNNGFIALVSQKSKQWRANLKMNGSVRALSFSADGAEMYSLGGDGEVYIWDMEKLECIHRHRDHGCVNGTAIAVSPCGKYYATGSDSGIVNLYSTSDRSSRRPKPLKIIENLTTAVDCLCWNHSSEILAIATRRKKDMVRLIHIPSRSVFTNWPTERTPLHYVQHVAFSPQSGFLTVANAKGKVVMLRLRYFSEA
eukprot:398923_1